MSTPRSLAGHQQGAGLAVVGDAVQDVRGDQGRRVWIETAHVDPAGDGAGLRREAHDVVGLPHVGEDLALDVLQLVQEADLAKGVVDQHEAVDAEVLGIDEEHGRGAIAHDELPAVGGQSPTLAGIVEAADRRQVVGGIDETGVGDIGQLVEAIAEDDGTLAEVARAQAVLLDQRAALQVPLHQPRLAVEAGGLEEEAVMEEESLGVVVGVVWVGPQDLVAIDRHAALLIDAGRADLRRSAVVENRRGGEGTTGQRRQGPEQGCRQQRESHQGPRPSFA